MTQLSAKVIQKCADTVQRDILYGTRAGLHCSTYLVFLRIRIGKRINVCSPYLMASPYGFKRPLNNHERKRRL